MTLAFCCMSIRNSYWRAGYIFDDVLLAIHLITNTKQELDQTMSTAFTALVLVLLGGALGHPLDKRDTAACSNINLPTTVNLVCQSLWYLEGTIAHCPNGSACNQTALMGIKSAIQSNLCSWVSALAIMRE